MEFAKIQSISDESATFKAEINGLLVLGRGMTRLVSGYKLLQLMYSRGVSPGEISSLVQKRRSERDLILGKAGSKYMQQKRDEDVNHGRKLMEIRIAEARGDWIEARKVKFFMIRDLLVIYHPPIFQIPLGVSPTLR